MQIDRFLTGFANCSPLLLLLFLLFSCQDDQAELPDLSADPLPSFELVRFEQALFQADTTDLAPAIEELIREYPSFSDIFFRFVIPLKRGDFDETEQILVLKAFLRYPLIQEIFSRSQQLYADMSTVGVDLDSRRSKPSENSNDWPALAQALQLYQYYLPQTQLPDTVTTFVSQFEYAGFLYSDNDLALGLDLFLGPDFNYRQVSVEETIFSDYLTRTYNSEHLVASAVRLLMEEDIPEPVSGRLIDYMVANGKRIYLLDKVLPFSSDTVKLRMSSQDLQWCLDNERFIYGQLAKEELLYSTDLREIRRHIDPAPTTRGMPEESPGEAANFIGWQMVKAYMERNPDTSIPELIALEDGQQLLSRSAYKPR